MITLSDLVASVLVNGFEHCIARAVRSSRAGTCICWELNSCCRQPVKVVLAVCNFDVLSDKRIAGINKSLHTHKVNSVFDNKRILLRTCR